MFDPAGAVSRTGTAVIALQNVSVRYSLPSERIPTLKELAIRRLRGERIRHREVWALRDVNLEIQGGEIFGVIGRNGTGKSTLLKVVARVLRPTTGRVWVRGRIAPLLELGAGFHPELTGRENVFLNGTLLGRTRREIIDRLESIFDFSELGAAIEAPLRTYSTGMVARLGFAVATAWRPDVLMLDEVLAVGDLAFQEKCKSRVRTFRDSGSTVLVVSHAADVIAQTCDRAVWLDAGGVRAIGRADEVSDAYVRHSTGSAAGAARV